MEHQALVTFVVVRVIVTTLNKVCVINGKDIDDHKLQYFSNSLRGTTTNWFARYETRHPTATWHEVWQAFISQFSEIHSKGQVATTLKYAKQKNYESLEDYYDRF
jgi:hypothetical protein